MREPIIEKRIKIKLDKRGVESVVNFEGKSRCVFIYEPGGKGMVRVYADDMDSYGFISDMFVREDVRNKGIGTKLLRCAETVIKEMDLNFAELRVSKGDWMEDWYEKNGFNYFSYEDGYTFMLKKL